ncbi:MAG: CHAT domain-containing protein [Lysobacterales bacterium]
MQALPGTRLEVEQIASLFASAEVFLDEQASESNLRESARDAGVLHVAAHAVIQVNPPMESFLQLSADDHHDGRLMAWEVLENLNLKAQLVALSGCATALGQGAPGEGLRGLTRAFSIAGARRVTASLWPVYGQCPTEPQPAWWAIFTAFAPSALTTWLPCARLS